MPLTVGTLASLFRNEVLVSFFIHAPIGGSVYFILHLTSIVKKMVPRTGLEPARSFDQWILSP